MRVKTIESRMPTPTRVTVEVKTGKKIFFKTGSMAGWNTVFVEVPLETFTPVKTVVDLLRPEHQA